LTPTASRYGAAPLRRRLLLGGLLLLAAALAIAAAGAEAGLWPAASVSALLRHGAAASLLGVIHAIATTSAGLWRRVSWPLLSSLANLLALRTAVWAGGLAEQIDLPFSAGPALASGVFAALYVQLAWRWLGMTPSATRTGAAALAGAGSFALLLTLRAAWDNTFTTASYLSVYWGVWMTSVTLVWAYAHADGTRGTRPGPRGTSAC
jgi:hypothetical protein